MSNDNLALLAASAYGEFPEINNRKKINESLREKSELSDEQARNFMDNYDILAHQPNTASGYSGTLIINKKTNQMFLLHRGTEFSTKEDKIADFELAITGLPQKQVEDAKHFVDDLIRRKIITRSFTNVSHSLGKTIGDAIHFTTDLSEGSIGFNGSGLSFWKGSLNVDSSSHYISDVPDSRFADKIKNRIFLEKLARENGNTFNFKKGNTVNYVSNGIRIVPNNIIYDQFGEVININIGNATHSITPFINSMDNIVKVAKKYKLNTQEAVKYYNIVSDNAYYYSYMGGHGVIPRYDESKVNKVIENYTAQNTDINATKLNNFIRTSYLKDKVRLKNVNFSNNNDARSYFDITSSRSTSLINNPDFFDTTKHKQIGVNKETLNALIDPKSISMSNMLTDNFRWANYNLSKDAINIPKYQPKFWSNQYETIMLNRSLGNRPNIPVDPLILDLNGDGAKAVSYNDKPVLFDIDNDGGSLEETGWFSHQDGLLVRDLNNNGKIDNMSEVFSEYYAGKAGRNGESGEKRFKNGFEALRTLDSNKDNVFDSKDRDFNAVRVWQDANQLNLLTTVLSSCSFIKNTCV